MAGSLDCEAEHYDLFMAIGELVLFSTIRKTEAEVGLITNGTSCHHKMPGLSCCRNFLRSLAIRPKTEQKHEESERLGVK